MILEGLGVGGGEGLEQGVGQAGGADAEVLVVQPLLAQDFLDDGVVLDSVLGGADATRSLEAHHASVLDEVFLDALAHHVGSLERSAGINLAGRGLDEVTARVHRQDAGAADGLGTLEQTRLEDDLQGTVTNNVLDLGDFVTQFLVGLVLEVAHVEHDVHFVGAVGNCQGGLGNLGLDMGLA